MNNVFDVKIHAVCLYYPKMIYIGRFQSFPICVSVVGLPPPKLLYLQSQKSPTPNPRSPSFAHPPDALIMNAHDLCAMRPLESWFKGFRKGTRPQFLEETVPLRLGGGWEGRVGGVWKRMWRSDLWKWKQNWILLKSPNAQILSDISILQNQKNAETCGFPPLSLHSEKFHNILSDAVCLEQGCIDCLRAVLDAGTALQIRGGEVGHPFLKLQEVRGLAAWRIMALPNVYPSNWNIGRRSKKKSHLQSLTKMK